MFLSKIELIGFKSFANKTVLYFNGGITAIVGPNGCGKTNIVDAVRWVLGEQKTSLLRSEVMENVIFNGSATRKPLGMAEVSITFQNDKGVLPTQFSEVTITRKLFRDGKSEYYINNNQCRLKDISDLFIDTGIGHNSYSIIELKMIETLLNGSLEERRRLLEEAAGIAKYKQRKKETTKKLESVQSDLLRIYDLVNEIEHQVRSLSKQAAKTKRYNKIHQELKTLELDYWLYHFRKANDLILKLEEENKKLLLEKGENQRKLEEINKEIETLQSEIEELGFLLENIRNEENDIFKKYSSVQNQINLEQEKVYSLNSSIKRIDLELIEINKLLEKFNNTLNELVKLRSEKNEQLEKTKTELTSLENLYKEVENKLNEQRELFQILNEKLVGIEKDLKYDKLSLDKLISGQSKLVSDKEKLLMSYNELNTNRIQKKSLIEKAKTEIDDLIKELNNLNSRINLLQEEIQKEKEQLSELQAKKSEYQLSIKEVNTSLEFLKSIFEVDESTGYLLKESNWNKEKKHFLLGEILAVDEQFRVAYDSLLGEFKNIVLVESEEEIEEAKEILVKERKGKCFFVSLDKVTDENIEFPKFEHSKVIAFASELPNVEKKIRNILKIILGNSVIVKDFDDAKEILEKFPVQAVVTLSGELVWGGHIQRRGSILHKEGLAIGKLDRIKKLERRKEELSNELNLVEAKISGIDKELAENSLTLTEMLKLKSNLENRLTQKKFVLNKEEVILEQIEKELKSIQNSIENKEVEVQKYNEDIKQLQDSISEKERIYNEIKTQVDDEGRKLADFQSRNIDEQNKIRDLEKKVVQLTTELSSLEKEILRIENSRNHNQKKLEKLLKDKEDNQKEVEMKNGIISRLFSQSNALESNLNEIKIRKEEVIKKIKELEDLEFQQNAYKERIQNTISQILSKLHQNEIEIARQKEVSHSYFSKALENYEINLNNYVLSAHIEEGDLNEIENKISTLKKSLASLGNVNFLALQEYESQRERLELYKNQIDDLVKSEKSLKEALREINETAEKKFLDTFKLVNENFNKVFKELFGPESFAELVIDFENPLDSDLEIRVKPSGKKINSIETLSQGEKTLTVLSLLFALYLVKPSPFCILDEVDAPLDDANVDRFLNLLKRFSNEVQFIIITHNKRTMEFANSLYGVTMAEDGISKVLSVKLVE